jgi:hypothetical protein
MDPLDQAKALIDGDRARQHGDAEALHSTVAKLWEAYLGRGCGLAISTDQVLVMLALLKIARTQHGETNRDDYVDALGYIALAGRIIDKRLAEDEYEMSLSIPSTGSMGV